MKFCPSITIPPMLSRILRSLSPRGGDDAQIVLLTPGIYNSAYFEHSFPGAANGH